MIDKDAYQNELVRMLDSLRTTDKGEHSCEGAIKEMIIKDYLNDCEIEKNMVEAMHDKIEMLKWDIEIANKYYNDLHRTVLDFFKNVRNNQKPLIECIEDFESDLWNYCDIGIDEEIEFDKENKQ